MLLTDLSWIREKQLLQSRNKLLLLKQKSVNCSEWPTTGNEVTIVSYVQSDTKRLGMKGSGDSKKEEGRSSRSSLSPLP